MTEQIKEIIYADPFSLLVITGRGKLRRLFTPFRVRCVMPVDRIPHNTIVYVEAIFTNQQYCMVYMINQRMYPYKHFQIELVH